MSLALYKQQLQPVGNSLALTALVAALPLVTLFVLLGGLRMKAYLAGLISLAVAIGIALFAYHLPLAQTGAATLEGAAFGFFPIMWIVINAIWVYNLTVATGHFEVLRRSFESVSPDQRIQAVIIAFCFGALLEALAGFGTPVAITVVMLMAVGFQPVKAATIALIANTAPVAFGALAAPITGLQAASGLKYETLGAMVGRQTPLLAIFVPLILVYVVDGRRGLRQTWLPALVAGVSFGIAQYVASNYISVPLTDVIASLVAAACVILLLRFWSPSESPDLSTHDRAAAAHGGAPRPMVAGGSVDDHGRLGANARRDADVRRDPPGEVARAYAPYLIIIAVFTVFSLDPVKKALGKMPWTYKYHWPGLQKTDIVNRSGKALSQATFTFNWLIAAGTLMIIAGLLTMIVLRVSPARALRAYIDTLDELKFAILTVMAVLALAYVMNVSGQTVTLGSFLAKSGAAFAFLSPILGWIGVAVTGSDTSANALFGGLQVTAAKSAGLNPVLLAAANSSGGVMGKMVSPQNLAIAASAVGMAGQEGDIFRKCIGWSLFMLLFMCVLVLLQSGPLSFMIPN